MVVNCIVRASPRQEVRRHGGSEGCVEEARNIPETSLLFPSKFPGACNLIFILLATIRVLLA